MDKKLARDVMRMAASHIERAKEPHAGTFEDRQVVVKLSDLLRVWELAHAASNMPTRKK